MYRRLAVLAGGLVLLCSGPLAAQDLVLGQMYGSGVHAYFSQDYRQAYDDLTSAMDAGTTDPRCYYFRGLCFLKLGREDEAKMDFEEAARLEAEDINNFYHVGRALERVQGSTRLLVEQYRVDARMAARKRAQELLQQRYGELREAQQQVLQTQAEAAPETPIELPAQPAATADPLGIGPVQQSPVGPEDVPATMEEEAPAEVPAQPAEAAEDPFAEVPAPEEKQDPFAVQPTEEPGAKEPADVPATTANGGAVLGALGKALGKAAGTVGQQAPAVDEEDPFGLGGAKEQPAEEAAPAPEPTEEPAGEAEAAPPPKPPAADQSDPFGLDAGAEEEPEAKE